MSGGDGSRQGLRVTRLRQPCPRCNDDMMRMYRQRRGTNSWDYVWFCLTCRHEVVIPDEGES